MTSTKTKPSVFTLEANRWYAAELIGDEFGLQHEHRSHSAIYVRKVTALKTGGGQLDLEFFHANYPEGVQDKQYRLRMIHRGARYVLMQYTLPEIVRILLVYEITWDWLGKHFGMRPRTADETVEEGLGRP